MPKVLFEREGSIAIITINRPEAMNAIDDEVNEGLTNAWTEVRDNSEIRIAILTGAGDKSFCAGGDLKTFIPKATTGERRGSMDMSVMLTLKGVDFWKPIIAAVNGFCIAGGMEILCSTDIRVASENASFAVAEARWGLFPGGGTTVRLPRQIPFALAMEMLYGLRVDAQTALRAGLVNKVVPQSELMATAMDYAERINEHGPIAIQAVKRSVLKTMGVPTDIAYYMESFISNYVFSTDDAKEGPRAFAEKRKPNFKGK